MESEIKSQCNDEYEIQHFGFSSSELKTEFRSNVINQIKTINSEIEETIVRKLNLDSEKKKILHHETKKLLKYSLKKLEGPMKKFDESIDQFCSIPQHIVLPEDEFYLNKYDHEDYENILRDITNLEHQYKKEKALLATYQQELEFINSFEPLQAKVSHVIKAINTMPPIAVHTKELNTIMNLQSQIDQVIKKSELMQLETKLICHEKKFVLNDNELGVEF